MLTKLSRTRKYPTATAGKCKSPYTTIDSTTHDKQYPDVSYVKRGIATQVTLRTLSLTEVIKHS